MLVLKDVCGNLAETLATADLVVLEVGVVGEEADDLVSPVAIAVVPEWWVIVAFAAAALLFVVVLASFMMMITFFVFFFFNVRPRIPFLSILNASVLAFNMVIQFVV